MKEEKEEMVARNWFRLEGPEGTVHESQFPREPQYLGKRRRRMASVFSCVLTKLKIAHVSDRQPSPYPGGSSKNENGGGGGAEAASVLCKIPPTSGDSEALERHEKTGSEKWSDGRIDLVMGGLRTPLCDLLERWEDLRSTHRRLEGKGQGEWGGRKVSRHYKPRKG